MENGKTTQAKSTIYDIAARANVSTTTVYKVLHNKKGVGEERRQMILDIAKELNYTRNAAAQSLSRKEIHIGVVSEVHNREFGAHILEGIRYAFDQLNDYKVIGHFGKMENALNRARILADFEEMLNAEMDAVILFPTQPYKEYSTFNARIEERGIPVVTINNEIPHLKCLCSVQQDGMMLGQMAADLINLCSPGGRNAVFIGSKGVYAQNASAESFASSVEKLGGEVSITYETQVDNQIGYLLTENLARNYPDVNGVFVGVSQCLGVLERLEQFGTLEQYRIVAVDTYPEVMEHLRRRSIIATLDRHPFTMGQVAVNVLYQYLAKGIVPASRIIVSPSIVMPESADSYASRDQAFYNLMAWL